MTVEEKPGSPLGDTTTDLGLPARIPAPGGRTMPVEIIARRYRPSYQVVPEPAGTRFDVPAFPSDRVLRRSRLARIMPGVSVSHRDGLAGSIGAIVYDNRTGVACVLSNAHVLAGPGDEYEAEVVQPGRSDDGAVSRNHLGRVLRSHIGLAGDCAVSSIEGRLYSPSVLGLNVVPRRIARVELCDRVVKSGRTTGVTAGTVVRVGVVVNYNYGPPVGRRQIGGFEIAADPADPPADGQLSAGGDSGACWIMRDAAGPTDIVGGLHFAEQVDPLGTAVNALACSIHRSWKSSTCRWFPKGDVHAWREAADGYVDAPAKVRVPAP